MFEVLINAAKVVLSKDVRDGMGALAQAFRAVNEWQGEICTVDLTCTKEFREKVDLIEDLIKEKLTSLGYTVEPVTAFSTVFRELTSNGFEHGTRGESRMPIRTVVDISKTYVSTTVHNPRRHEVKLPDWIEAGARHLVDTEMSGRGRGLLMVYAKADLLDCVGDTAVKGVVYRERVSISEERHGDEILIAPTSGFSNPAFARRVYEFLKKRVTDPPTPIILCLDPKQGSDLLAAAQSETPRHIDSQVIYTVISYIRHVSARGKMSDKIRLVYDDADLNELLPADIVFQSIRAARDSLRASATQSSGQ